MREDERNEGGGRKEMSEWRRNVTRGQIGVKVGEMQERELWFHARAFYIDNRWRRDCL